MQLYVGHRYQMNLVNSRQKIEREGVLVKIYAPGEKPTEEEIAKYWGVTLENERWWHHLTCSRPNVMRYVLMLGTDLFGIFPHSKGFSAREVGQGGVTVATQV